MIHALIKTTRTTAFALRRHTHTTAEVVELGREDWCENFVHTIPIHNDTSNTRNIHTQTENTSGHTHCAHSQTLVHRHQPTSLFCGEKLTKDRE